MDGAVWGGHDVTGWALTGTPGLDVTSLWGPWMTFLVLDVKSLEALDDIPGTGFDPWMTSLGALGALGALDDIPGGPGGPG